MDSAREHGQSSICVEFSKADATISNNDKTSEFLTFSDIPALPLYRSIIA